jgi:serine phosphatase RsbU (regulator of sigma subunit)
MRQVKHHLRRQGPNHHARPKNQFSDDLLLGAKGVYEALCAPGLQRIGGFDVACATVPARHISGDFVTTFQANGSWFVALGDLMGKGLSAAMWLTHVLDLLRRSCERAETLGAVMQYLNGEVYRSRVGVPLTSLFLMRLDPNESRLWYSCGGCPPAFLLRHGGRVFKLERGGPLLGALEHATYTSATIEFCPGDTLLVASDGITEMHHGVNIDEQPERVPNDLQSASGNSAASIVESLLMGVKHSSSTVADDLTVLAVQRVA